MERISHGQESASPRLGHDVAGHRLSFWSFSEPATLFCGFQRHRRMMVLPKAPERVGTARQQSHRTRSGWSPEATLGEPRRAGEIREDSPRSHCRSPSLRYRPPPCRTTASAKTRPRPLVSALGLPHPERIAAAVDALPPGWTPGRTLRRTCPGKNDGRGGPGRVFYTFRGRGSADPWSAAGRSRATSTQSDSVEVLPLRLDLRQIVMRIAPSLQRVGGQTAAVPGQVRAVATK